MSPENKAKAEKGFTELTGKVVELFRNNTELSVEQTLHVIRSLEALARGISGEERHEVPEEVLKLFDTPDLRRVLLQSFLLQTREYFVHQVKVAVGLEGGPFTPSDN